MHRITHVQYDGSGDWLEVTFDDGRKAHFTASLVYQLGKVTVWDVEQKPEEGSDDGTH